MTFINKHTLKIIVDMVAKCVCSKNLEDLKNINALEEKMQDLWRNK